LTASRAGYETHMLGLALALIVIGVLLGFIVFPFGFLPGVVGVILLVLFLVGFGRRAQTPGP
jgi:hypothetical protein